MDKEKRVELLSTAGKALLELVPFVGGSVSSIIGDYQAERKHQRLVDFFESLKNDLESVKESINRDFIEKDDFLSIFEETTRRIVSERTLEKRIAFKNILVNSTIRTDVDYDEIEEQLRLLERLRKEHLLLLKILSNPIAFDKELGSVVGDGGGMPTSLYSIMSKLLPTWKPESVLEVSSDLQSERLIKDFSNNLGTMLTDRGIHHLQNRITEKGNRFYKFVTVE